MKYTILTIIAILPLTHTHAATSFTANIDFNEVAFPTSTTLISGSTSYNVLDDATGAELAVLNGDADDLTINVSSTGAGFTEYRTTSSGSFRLDHGFTSSPTSNNTGERIINELGVNFSSHLNVTDLSFDVSSTNTAGLSWEVTIFQLLDENGDPFTAAPTIAPYLTHSEINGLFDTGTYVLDSLATVLDVGTDTVSAGASNPNENFTVTGDLGYSDFGLALGTQVTGLRLTTILEDTRGVNNTSSNFSSSLIDIAFSGEISSVPEPSSIALLGLGSVVLWVRRKPSDN